MRYFKRGQAYEKYGFGFAYENSEECDGTVYDFIRMSYKNPKINLGGEHNEF
ncbi:hypothetical protein LGL55_16750 [Clostridium tagluense]|uniref:hypothetical protein n=1 Tax=Clostridium tagluense TaxID=360422 RepID=UPI001C0E2D76|nr:hypothetical protein [Clostridium tagluense]MBU3127878.1 hypothetical protein [Clostridium tagluense]MCB2322466.1 hypothetical protein [Clostridium tagluense]MCB2337120.1 hypothetical protein [Clostridium tagluense]MCB2365857.1 hypothetical protein [Clostridium tagluense]